LREASRCATHDETRSAIEQRKYNKELRGPSLPQPPPFGPTKGAPAAPTRVRASGALQLRPSVDFGFVLRYAAPRDDGRKKSNKNSIPAPVLLRSRSGRFQATALPLRAERTKLVAPVLCRFALYFQPVRLLWLPLERRGPTRPTPTRSLRFG
jgi:hypothetical protein